MSVSSHWTLIPTSFTLLTLVCGCTNSTPTEPLSDSSKPAVQSRESDSDKASGNTTADAEKTIDSRNPAEFAEHSVVDPVVVTDKRSAATLEEAKQIAQAIEIAIAHQDLNSLTALIDQDQFADRILNGLAVPGEFRRSYHQQIQEDGGLANVASEIITAVHEGGDYSLVQIFDRNGVHRPLFRLLLPGGRGFNHHEIILNHDQNGKPRIVDIFVYLTGEEVSNSLRGVDLPLFLTRVPGLQRTLTGDEARFAENLATLEQIQTLVAEGRGSEAMPLFESLPESLATNKRMLMTKLSIAQSVDDAAYFEVLELLQKHHANDSAFLFRMLDMLAVQQRYEDVLQTADVLQKMTGDDYLNLMKVNAFLGLGRIADAKEAVSAAKNASDNRIDLYWIQMSVLLKDKDHAAVANLLNEIAQKFGLKFNDLSAIADYADFVASVEGQAWLDAQQTAATESAVPKVPNSPASEPPPVPSVP